MAWTTALARITDRAPGKQTSRTVLGRSTSRLRHNHLVTKICTACGAGATIALVCIATTDAAHAVTVQPGQTLQVTFNESGPSSVQGGLVTGAGGRLLDTLEFYETDTGGYNGPNGIARLFNGATLLGTVNFTAHGGGSFGFVAPGSAFNFPPVGTVNDWTSLIDGTINGILDITFNRTIDVSIDLLGLGIGYFSQGFEDASPQPTITGQNVLAATPLPATLPLFASGLVAMALLGWRNKRKARVKIA